MPEYKLVYFNGRGLGELIRWIFLHGDIPFTDERVEMSEWPEKKKVTPGGKLPLLYIDGKPLWQSMAIGRFAAKLAGLTLDDTLDACYCDAFVETAKDLLTEMYKILLSEKSQEEKDKELREEYVVKTLTPVLEKVNKRLETKQWLIGDKMTWADLAISRSIDEVAIHISDVVSKYPNVSAHAEKIHQLPKIKEWRAKRPNSPF
uniref:glutathione transferase n=1 Tax=Scylla olivacea TaxID=85551 RepID=A0A0N7ZBC2_SCYOL